MSLVEIGPEDRAVDVVFCHATGFNALTYLRILAPLAESRRIVIPDQRGHGFSTLSADPAGRRDWLDFRDDLLALGEALRLKGAILSGHSMGATVSLLAAAASSALASKLVLFEPVVFSLAERPQGGEAPPSLAQGAARRRAVFPSREAAFSAYVGRGAFAAWPAEMIADYVEGGFRDLPSGEVRLCCEPAFEAAIYAFQAHDSLAAFEAARVSIEVWKAEQGSTFRLNPVLLPRVRIVTVEGAGHFLPMERPDVVRAAFAG
ncbi:MAG: alpha/beta fold hydrolase [Caulobacteraceae bacterium]